MASIIFDQKTRLTTDEVREILALMDNQDTTDRYTDTAAHINGDYAEIDVSFDSERNVTIC